MWCKHAYTTIWHIDDTKGKVLGQRIEMCESCKRWRTVSPTGVRGGWENDVVQLLEDRDEARRVAEGIRDRLEGVSGSKYEHKFSWEGDLEDDGEQ